jgi:hypothetical protein
MMQMLAASAGSGGLVSPQKGIATAAPTTAVAAPSSTAEADSGPVVLGYDSPCQRAVIRDQKDMMHRTEQALTAAVAQLKGQLWQWLGQERQWSPAWNRMIEELD